jgi:hypothetical protein
MCWVVVRPQRRGDADIGQRCTSNPETMMRWAGEPKLEEVLSDPIVRAVMARDRVDLEGLRLLLRNATKLLALRSDGAAKRKRYAQWGEALPPAD